MDAGLVLVIGAMIALLIGIIKNAAPGIPADKMPLVALGISAIVIGVGALSGEVDGTPFTLFAEVIAQAATAVGLREGKELSLRVAGKQ